MNKIAFITGVTGQDGSYLSEYLLGLGYKVYGMRRRSSTDMWKANLRVCLEHPRFTVVEGDMTDPSSIYYLLQNIMPDEIYNLAAQSHVGTSFEQPSYTWQVNYGGCLNILETVRKLKLQCKIYQASSSEIFGSSVSNIKLQNGYYLTAQYEKTEFKPNSPYAIAKLAAHNLMRVYREAYNMYNVCGILFNHESERRGEYFLSRKVTKYIGQLLKSKQSHKLLLGNSYAIRDWGYSPDYVKAMYLMMQQSQPDDFVVGTGIGLTVKDLVRIAFEVVNLDYTDYVIFDMVERRPLDVDFLMAYPQKIKNIGWENEISIKEMLARMIDNDKI